MISNEAFAATVWDYYHEHGRHDLPWRQAAADGGFDPYHIMVSELMLQQTQVARVIPKYQAFLEQFPTVKSLAAAPLGDVLRTWSGLGYNRRAKFLHQAAQRLVHDYQGKVPQQPAELLKLSGIGPGTVGAILVYAYNQPVAFVETNIRTVFIHHFFSGQAAVTDQDILKLVNETLDREQPRAWYWALMDYGSYLKQLVGNLSRQSAGYARQSAFAGSRRQLRGQILRLLGTRPYSLAELRAVLSDPRLVAVIDELLNEQLIRHLDDAYYL